MTKTHPITPPPELVQQWVAEANEYVEQEEYAFANLAAQWGANQELEACRMEIIDGVGRTYLDETRHRVLLAEDIWTARRPKLPSLKEQALEELNLTADSNGAELSRTQVELIRRALEALPND
jgi:hypothetical protein